MIIETTNVIPINRAGNSGTVGVGEAVGVCFAVGTGVGFAVGTGVGDAVGTGVGVGVTVAEAVTAAAVD